MGGEIAVLFMATVFCASALLVLLMSTEPVREPYERDILQHPDGRLSGSGLHPIPDIVLVRYAVRIHGVHHMTVSVIVFISLIAVREILKRKGIFEEDRDK